MSVEVVTFVNGKWRQNCYLIANEGESIIVDPGSDPDEIVRIVTEKRWRVHGIVNTHGHYDHVGAVAAVREKFEVPFYLHTGDEQLLKRANLYRMMFESRNAIKVPPIDHDISALPRSFHIGPFDLEWIGTPGHTDGSVCLLMGDYLFSGDTLMRGCVGRTDLPGGNRDLLVASVRGLMDLPGSTIVCGGHGERTSIEAESAPGARVSGLIQ